jgi:hypothetical protein
MTIAALIAASAIALWLGVNVIALALLWRARGNS